ncbi:hypothetical protein JZ751_018800 [Albula glossodonta]|uniref:Uncharacterized protein n=1 Tax=Albula glossodonta TaxID=121402 RepID=A0A8T2NQ46_9TELE|nr:hypothetical protein JZ751_018800 [Albula glossodonta]
MPPIQHPVIKEGGAMTLALSPERGAAHPEAEHRYTGNTDGERFLKLGAFPFNGNKEPAGVGGNLLDDASKVFSHAIS